MVFISYSSLEYATAFQIRSALESNNIDCWMAPESIPPGSDYADVIQGAIKESDIFLLVLSEASQKSKWVRKELDKALDFDKIIIPIHIDKSELVSAFDYCLTNVEWIEAFGHLSEAISRTVKVILALQEHKKPVKDDQPSYTKEDDQPGYIKEDDQPGYTKEDIVAYNKAKRIKTAKTIIISLFVFLAISAIMFGINILIRNPINHLLDAWFYADGSKTVQDIAMTNPILLIVLGMLALLPVAWLLSKGNEIDSPTLKILGILLLILETCLLHFLPFVATLAIVILIIGAIIFGADS